ncbi:MAG: hypothetical protein CM1200mP40_10940 [Gammaproteobacteria bacterium]|jgi:uncharacterized protein (DUF885 family)|nr:DUF885 domain-containing protein [Pseudomonadales bacterium]GIT21412.1 MAG: hypothetical protein CM1200mP40_10940 [Gammaproteobacteria bacterium]
MRSFSLFLLLVVALNSIQTFAQSDRRQLEELLADYWSYTLQESPTLATRAGVNDFNHLLPQVSPVDQARKLRSEEAFQERLNSIDRDSLNRDNQVNYDLLDWELGRSIDGMRLNTSRIPFNTFSSFFSGALRASFGINMNTEEDYRDYIARIEEFPRYFNENIENMRQGIRDGFVLPKIIIGGVLPTVQAQVYDNPDDSSLADPILDINERLPEAVRTQIINDTRNAIRTYAIPSFRQLVTFLEEEYYPAATEGIAATDLENGEEYYSHQIRVYTTRTDLTADDIHEIGLSEVTRIRSEMDALIEESGFEGSFGEFTEFLRTDPQFYAETAEELLQAASFVAKKIDYRMPEFFGRLPRTPYGVVPVPDEIAPNFTTAAYNYAVVGGTRGGAYWVNTYALDQRPLYELPALTAHEAVPGHHQQNAIASEIEGVPEFRKVLGYSAFGEGWGLYSEKLAIDMDIYENEYEHFGRLSYEMWRACRLVIDTGIHAKGWSRQQALDYLGDNTSLSQANIRAEVDRYISWPGQALAYKLGEMKILELRARAETELDDRFDIREFHDVVLGQGALPLDLLERVVNQYIEEAL